MVWFGEEKASNLLVGIKETYFLKYLLCTLDILIIRRLDNNQRRLFKTGVLSLLLAFAPSAGLTSIWTLSSPTSLASFTDSFVKSISSSGWLVPLLDSGTVWACSPLAPSASSRTTLPLIKLSPLVGELDLLFSIVAVSPTRVTWALTLSSLLTSVFDLASSFNSILLSCESFGSGSSFVASTLVSAVSDICSW